jgi:hypothetical protein
MLSKLIDRGDPALAKWAVDWLGLDLAAAWEGLEDHEKDWLVSNGVVHEIEADVECTDAEHWSGEWQSDVGAGWPCYTLEIAAEGMEPIEVRGWHVVAEMGPDGNRQYAEWATEDGDGCSWGLPRVDEWDIEPGDNLVRRVAIPCWRLGDRWVTLDRDKLGDRHWGALAEAAGAADHGDEPTWEDVEKKEMKKEDAAYVIRDQRVVEVDIETGGVAYDRSHESYYATAWSHSLTEGTFADAGATRKHLAELADDETVYKSEKAARAKLWQSFVEDADVPDDAELEVGPDGPRIVFDDGWAAELDDDDVRLVSRQGWGPFLVAKCFGYRSSDFVEATEP